MNPPVPYELISAYFDGEVTPEERGQVEQLLESSSELRQFLDDASKLSALLHSFPREATPVELAANVQRRVNALEVIVSPSIRAKRTSFRREWTTFFAGMMATMASLFCFYVVFNHSRTVNEDQLSFSAKSHLEESLQKSRSENERRSVIASSDHEFPAGNVQRESMEVGNQPGQRVFSAPEASPEAESLSSLQTGLSSYDGSIVESSAPDQFLSELKKGEIWQRKIQPVDPNSAVAVVELTVVDIVEGADGIKLLFKQRHLPPVEGDDSLAKREDKPNARSRRMNNKQDSAEDLVVFFVKAPGAQLAEALEESLKDTNVYKNLATQSPIPLPANTVTNSTAMASRKATADGSNSGATWNDNVAFEANLAVNSYADNNGMMLEESQKTKEKQKKDFDTQDGKQRFKDETTSSARSEQLPVAAKLAAPRVASDVSDKVMPENAKTSGYATFQLVNNPRQSNRQQQLSRAGYASQLNEGYAFGNRAIPFNNAQATLNNAQTTQFGNVNTPLLQSEGQGQGQANFQRRANSDPQLMRLLIVLKPEQPAPPPPP